MDNASSEEFRKYLVGITIRGKRYFTVSGADLHDDDKDKIMLDENNKPVVFRNIETLLNYINKADRLFDIDNFRRWAVTISTNEKTYADVYLEDLDQIDNLINSTDTYEDIVNAVYLIQDYAIQVNNEELKRMLDYGPLLEFRNFFVEHYVFKSDEDTLGYLLQLREDLLLKEMLAKVQEYFLKSIVIL